MANERLKVSAKGLAALRQREGIALQYYNDIANNCTFGIGGLVHLGPCTEEELSRPVTIEDVTVQLTHHVKHFESVVRRKVNDHELTQDQFDALVSFVFNVGATGSKSVLSAANRGESKEVANKMRQFVYVHPRSATGKKMPAFRSPGLVKRRAQESAPFLEALAKP